MWWNFWWGRLETYYSCGFVAVGEMMTDMCSGFIWWKTYRTQVFKYVLSFVFLFVSSSSLCLQWDLDLELGYIAKNQWTRGILFGDTRRFKTSGDGYMMTLIKSNTDPPPKKKANYRTKVMVVEIWRISPFNTLINWVLDNWPKISRRSRVKWWKDESVP